MDLTKPITEEDLRIHFDYLFTEYGFSVKQNVYNEKHFGNAVVILASKAINIRIIRDKGQLFVDINSPLDETVWFDLNAVLTVINRRDWGVIQENSAIYETAKTEQLFEISELLRRQLPMVISLFEAPHYKETKEQLMALSTNWYSLALEIFANSRDFNEDESTQYYSVLRKMGRVRRVLYDL